MSTVKESGGANWQIATSCDIELSKRFAEGEVFEGKVLDIDSDAIYQTVRQLERDPGDISNSGNQSLLFEAVDAANPFFLRKESRRIARGAAILDTETGDIEVYAAASHISRRARYAFVFFGRMPTIRSAKPEQSQKTAVHELQHAVDYTDAELNAQSDEEAGFTRANKAFVLGELALRKIAYLSVGGALGAEAIQAAGYSKPVPIFGALLGAAIASRIARRGREKARQEASRGVEMYKYRFQDTGEKRARSSARQAGDHPQIISIH